MRGELRSSFRSSALSATPPRRCAFGRRSRRSCGTSSPGAASRRGLDRRPPARSILWHGAQPSTAAVRRRKLVQTRVLRPKKSRGRYLRRGAGARQDDRWRGCMRVACAPWKTRGRRGPTPSPRAPIAGRRRSRQPVAAPGLAEHPRRQGRVPATRCRPGRQAGLGRAGAGRNRRLSSVLGAHVRPPRRSSDDELTLPRGCVRVTGRAGWAIFCSIDCALPVRDGLGRRRFKCAFAPLNPHIIAVEFAS